MKGISPDVDRRPHRIGHGIGGDVVMCGTDPTGCENMCIGRRQRLNRGLDAVMFIGDNARLHQADAVIGQRAGQKIRVAVAGAPRQDFVSDHQHRGGGGVHGRLACLSVGSV